MQFPCARKEVHHREQQKCLIKVLAAVCDYGTWVLNSSRKRNPSLTGHKQSDLTGHKQTTLCIL